MKSILVGLTLISWTALSQPSTGGADSVYCLSIESARLLIADALRLRVQLDLNDTLSARVALLKSQQIATYNSFTNLLKIEQEKTQYHKEISKHMESLYLSEREQKNYYIKRERKMRRKITYLGVGLLVLIVVK